MGRFLDVVLERSVMLWLAAAMVAVSAIGFGGMVLSTMVAERVQGSGSAINVAGSLRRLSHRMGSIVLSDAENNYTDHTVLQGAIVHFEATLNQEVLTDALKRQPDGPAMQTYRLVQDTWQRRLKPMLAEQALAGPNLFPVETHNNLLLLIDEFVDQINTMVAQLEADTEDRISHLRAILWGALGLSVLVLLMGLYLIRRRVLQPLDALLAGAERIASGDFSARTEHTGQDELGRVGQAFNIMAEAVSRSHQDLESQVREQTAELTRSNRSLALLYNAISLLNHAPTDPNTYRTVLSEIDELLNLQGSMACIQAKHGGPASLLTDSLPGCDHRTGEKCGECLASVAFIGGLKHYMPTDDGQVLNLPLQDMDGTYGVLRLSLPHGRRLEPWQEQLLEALVRHIGIALGMSRKIEQERLLALQEERSTIARELHDSIAQSLSYMKIQASLLQPVLSDPGRRDQAEAALRDLREGITAAYRQLRELLATFRLKMEGDFLALLSSAVEEYSLRGGLPIHLETQLAGCQLSPNQEIHTLQVVREALSNVLRHAHATQAWVRVVHDGDGAVEAWVEDDGIGPGKEIKTIAADTFHYGLTIMHERAQGLHGQLAVEPRPEGGTRVKLQFHAHAIPIPEPA